MRTAIGTPKYIPVAILNIPVNIRVELKSIDFALAKAVISGRRVPRSPRLPDISPNGLALKVWML